MTYGGLTCEFCGGQHPVAALFTSLANGDTLTMCAEDISVALIPLLAGNLGVDPQRFYDSVKRFVDREAAREAKETAARPEQDQHIEPSERALSAQTEWLERNGSEDAVERRMTDPLLHGGEDE